MPESSPAWVGVMRHVSAHQPADPHSVPEPGRRSRRGPGRWGGCSDRPVVTSEGRTIALQAGYALAETLDHALLAEEPSDREPGARGLRLRLLHPDTAVTRRTVELLQQGLAEYSSAWDGLTLTVRVDICPKLLMPSAPATVEAYVQAARGELLGDREPPVVVAVMHDPAASWLLHGLVKPANGPRTSFIALFSDRHLQAWLHRPAQLPLRNGELVMTHGQGEARKPVWAISPGSEKLIEDVRDKISKKLDSAKQLGAFATALFSFALTGVLREPPAGALEVLAWSGIATLAMAVIAFFSTLFRYDSLLMPTPLWASTPPRAKHARLGVFARPPSSAAWVLFQNMMVIWLRGFTVACALVALGGVLVIIALGDPTGWRGWGLVVLVLAPTTLLGSILWRRTRPELGVND